MNNRVQERQNSQKLFLQSGNNLSVGTEADCPLSPQELSSLPFDSKYVVEKFSSGLTATVLHLSIEGKEYCLKQKRQVSLVKNIDGETSFLNEVQRRLDFTRLKAHPSWAERLTHIVPTLYADYDLGIILSPWLPGKPLRNFNASIFKQVLETAVACEEAGLMEWDLCPGNILEDQGKIFLFDFGYMYPFNPLTEFNSNGTSDPLFHACERFETRNFFGRVLASKFKEEEVLQLYRELKTVAYEVYREKLSFLEKQGASLEVIGWVKGILRSWEDGLSHNESFRILYLCENFRSQVLDIEDDLHGKSCTSLTLRRIDFVQSCLREHYSLLSAHGALFYSNDGKDQSELLNIYSHKRKLALSYQL